MFFLLQNSQPRVALFCCLINTSNLLQFDAISYCSAVHTGGNLEWRLTLWNFHLIFESIVSWIDLLAIKQLQ